MSVAVSDKPVIVPAAQSVALSQLFQIAAAAGNPTYLVLSAFDRDEYAVSSSQQTGTLSGAGLTLGLSTLDGDTRETGIVFTYQPSTGQYVNAAYGNLEQLTYTASSSLDDITDLSLFGTSSLRTATAYATDAYSLMLYDAPGYLGTATIATLPSFSFPVPSQATPDAIAAIADSFVGDAWNVDGCWTLASTFAAEAGASLPVQSTLAIAGVPNGEWFVAYNGPAGSSGNWQSLVQTGDMISFITGSGGGHITTCVAGSGGSAQLVDNITYVDQNGFVINSANDGSQNDVVIEAPHPATQEWAGVSANSVVIYRLDTPLVTAELPWLSLSGGAEDSLSSLFYAADPAGKSIASYQVYVSNANDQLDIGGVSIAAQSPATAAWVGSLANVDLAAGLSGGADQVSVRAFNGSFWGDWTTLSVSSSATSAASGLTPSEPSSVVTAATAPISSETLSIYRFFDTVDGTHFFTESTTERDNLIATRPDLTFEGVGMNAVNPASDPNAEAVYRFFDTTDGNHFYTADTAERDQLIASDPTMMFEGTAFYEDATPVAGDSPVYRFFDSLHGTHLYTENAAEQASILATRPDLRLEGIAFYAPTLT